MKIGIVGAGAIGLLFACYLSENNQVTIYCRTKSQVDLINRYGIFMTHLGVRRKFDMIAKQSEEIEDEDFVIFAVKQYHFTTIKQLFRKIPPSTPLLFLQNGVGHISFIKDLEHEKILLGVVEHGSMKENRNHVQHTGSGLTKIAVYRWNKNEYENGKETLFIKELVRKLESEYFPFLYMDNYQNMIFEKLIINAVINPLTAILKIRNGDLIENRNFFCLAKMTFNEVADILNLSNREKSFQQLLDVCQKTAENQSSMLRDVLNRRPTEIEGIIGGLLNIAEKNKVTAPYLQFLYHSVKGMENKGGSK